jgi:voltage-gated potassium channel
MEIILCTEKDIQNPMPDHVHFIKSDMLASNDIMERAAVVDAQKILVMAKDDEQALAVSISAYTVARTGEALQQMVTYCNSEHMAQLIRNACPTCEAFSSRSVDMMVRACQDPGSTQVHEQMLSAATGPTQYRVQLPAGYESTFGTIYQTFKERWNATPLGIARSATGGLEMNPTSDTMVTGEQYIFYIADSRITPQQLEREIA